MDMNSAQKICMIVGVGFAGIGLFYDIDLFICIW